MYTLDELNAMSEDQLRKLANEMGMNNTDSVGSQTMAYYILDNQAITTAKEQSSKKSTPKRKENSREKNCISKG